MQDLERAPFGDGSSGPLAGLKRLTVGNIMSGSSACPPSSAAHDAPAVWPGRRELLIGLGQHTPARLLAAGALVARGPLPTAGAPLCVHCAGRHPLTLRPGSRGGALGCAPICRRGARVCIASAAQRAHGHQQVPSGHPDTQQQAAFRAPASAAYLAVRPAPGGLGRLGGRRCRRAVRAPRVAARAARFAARLARAGWCQAPQARAAWQHERARHTACLVLYGLLSRRCTHATATWGSGRAHCVHGFILAARAARQGSHRNPLWYVPCYIVVCSDLIHILIGAEGQTPPRTTVASAG